MTGVSHGAAMLVLTTRGLFHSRESKRGGGSDLCDGVLQLTSLALGKTLEKHTKKSSNKITQHGCLTSEH